MTKKKILAVDDDGDVLETTRMMLTNAGYEVISASNGRDAALLARKEKPGLIIMDIKMPGVDGVLATDLLKNDTSTSNIPIVYRSGLVKEKEITDDEGHVFGSKIGDVHFIPKDQDPDKLLAIIQRYIK